MGKPATAFTYRRCIALVQVLALGDYRAIQELCIQWGVKQQLVAPHEHNPLVMVTRLAQHALVDTREEQP